MSEEPTGLKVKVAIYVLKHDGDSYDSTWQSLYSTEAERDKELAEALDDDEDYSEAYKSRDKKRWRKSWRRASVQEKVGWYFSDYLCSGAAGSIEWDYQTEFLVYDIADLKPVNQ